MNTLRKLFVTLYQTYVDTVRLIVAHWQKFLPLILVPAVLSFIITVSNRLALINAFAHIESLNITSLFSLSNIVVILLSLCSVLIQLLGVITLIYFTTRHEQCTIMEALEESVGYLLKFVGITLLIFIVSMLGMVVAYIPVWLISIVVGFISKDALEPTLAWLSILPNIFSAFIAMFFIFAPYILIEDNATIFSALNRSRALVRQHLVRMTIIFAVAALFSYLLTFTLLYIPRVGSIISLLVITPFSTIYIYVIYRLYRDGRVPELDMSQPVLTTEAAQPIPSTNQE